MSLSEIRHKQMTYSHHTMLNEMSVKFIDYVTGGVSSYSSGEGRSSWLKYEVSSEVFSVF